MLRPCFYIKSKGLGEMFIGPLSDRIDCITEKPKGESRMKPDKKKSTLASTFLKKPDSQHEENIKPWEASQVNCPTPSRSPDPWVH